MTLTYKFNALPGPLPKRRSNEKKTFRDPRLETETFETDTSLLCRVPQQRKGCFMYMNLFMKCTITIYKV